MIRSFLITYDNHPPRNYVALYRLMAAWKAEKLAQSVWLVRLNTDAGVVLDVVRRALQLNDTVAVVELKAGADWATINVNPAASAWLSVYVTPRKKAA